MTRILSETDVKALVNMPLALEAVTIAFRSLGTRTGRNVPRERLIPSMHTGGATSLQVMSATVPELDAMGLKAYGTGAGGANFVVLLFRASTGELRGIVGADWLGRYRTGAATGLAASVLARPDSRSLAIIGAGGQAITQALAVVTALPGIREVRVWNRTEAHAATFSERLHRIGEASTSNVTVTPFAHPEAAVAGADVIVAITSARTPVLKGAWLDPGMHVTGAGINRANVAEIDSDAVARADIVAVDHLENARREAGDLILAVENGAFNWDRAVELGEILTGSHPGRTSPTQVTLFESQGIAAEDVALAALILDRAEAARLGDVTSLAGEREVSMQERQARIAVAEPLSQSRRREADGD